MELSKDDLKTVIQEAIVEASKQDRPKLSWTVEECALNSGIGETKIRELIAAKNTDFPHIKIGRKAVIPVDLFKHWMNEKAKSQSGI